MRRALLAGALSACAGLAQAAGSADITDLMRLWSGVHDSAVQVILDDHTPQAAAADVTRLRTVIEPVELPWLGPSVLYLEETLHDVPGAPRRQVLLRLSLDSQLRAQRIRVRQYTFRDPQQWRAFFGDRDAQQALRRTDLQTMPGCDLLLGREGDQFEGTTLGRDCVSPRRDPQRYVDYRLQVGAGRYWFRSRQFRFADDVLVQESAGFDWPSLHEARLFNCRIRASSSDRGAEASPPLSVALADHGGRADFSLPDGHTFRLILHSDDWPFDASNQALVLILQDLASGATTRSWTPSDALEISAATPLLEVRCGPVAPPAQLVPAAMRY